MLKHILEEWQRVLDRGEDYFLYLHSPFCVKRCRYCVYQGSRLVTDRDYASAYDAYINHYLPRAIENYRTIFEQKAPKGFYFGGGTPNLIRPEDLNYIFHLIPGFMGVKNKVTDVNPAYVSREFLQVLAKYRFSTVCLGIQTFDEKTLAFNNRDSIAVEKLQRIIEFCREAGIYTSADLMCYLNHYDERDLEILRNDLDTVFKLGLDAVTVNPNLHLVMHEPYFAEAFEDFMDRYMYGHRGSYVPLKKELFKPGLNERSIYRLVRKEYKDIYESGILNYYQDDFPLAGSNIIGIGDLNNIHGTESYIPHTLYYLERNRDNRPVYDIRYYRNFSGKHSAEKAGMA